MDDTRLMIGYAIWVIIIGLTLGFFYILLKKILEVGKFVVFSIASNMDNNCVNKRH